MAVNDEQSKNTPPGNAASQAAPSSGTPNTQMGAAFANAGVDERRRAASSGMGGSGDPAAGTTAQDPRGTTPRAENRTAFSWRGLGGMVNAPMGRTPASEVLTKLHRAIEAVYKDNTAPLYEFTLIPIDMNQTSTLVLSVLIVAAREVNNRNLGVAYHVMILEGSSEPFPPRFETSPNGVNVEILRPAGDANDEGPNRVVVEYLSRQFPQQRLHNADAEVVPREFNVLDENAVFDLAANAAYAVTHELEVRRPDFQDINLKDAPKDENLVVRVAFPHTQIVNAVHQPIRQGVAVDLSAVAANQSAQQQLIERTAVVSRVGGFIDLVWAPEAPPQAFQYYGAPQQMNYHRYAARLVMTHLQSVLMSTLPAQLLALVTSLSLYENNQWVQAFRPQAFSEGIDLHDIGAIGIEANFENNPSGIGARIDTKADSFKPEHLAKLVAAAIRPGLIMSLDVEECGPSTWYNGVFAAAAAGNIKANDIIIRAANELTNGAFSRHFSPTGRVAIGETDLVHMGTYRDRKGELRDIRDIDYLAVLNMMGEKDMEVVKDWSDTFIKVGYPPVQRLSGRKRILEALVNEVRITGFARRVTFEHAFLEALATACLESGLDVRAVTPYADAAGYERATAQFVGQTLMQPTPTGLFNRGFGATPNGSGPSRNFGGNRWF